jgi:hypothetical protein
MAETPTEVCDVVGATVTGWAVAVGPGAVGVFTGCAVAVVPVGVFAGALLAGVVFGRVSPGCTVKAWGGSKTPK